MANREYDMKDIERMLSPRCEFKASEGLMASVMGKAAAAAQRPKTQPFVRRFVPWIAAACAAAVILFVIPQPKSEKQGSMGASVSALDEDVTAEAKLPASIVEPGPTAQAETEAEGKAEPAQMAATKPASKPKADVVDYEAEAVTAAAVDFEDKLAISEPMPADEPLYAFMDGADAPNVIMEADLPITNIENYELTPEEMALIKKQEQLEFLGRMRLEMEVVALMIKSNDK